MKSMKEQLITPNQMFAGRRFRRLGMLSAFLACLVVAGVLGAAVVEDHADADVLLPGANVGGVDVGGYHSRTAVALVSREIAMPLLSPLVMAYGNRRWTLETAKMASVDTTGMVREAYAAGLRDRYVLDRVYHRVTAEPVPVRAELRFHFFDDRVQRFARTVRDAIDRPYIDAERLVVGTRIVISPSQTRRAMDLKRTSQRIRDALPKGVRRLRPAVKESKPRVTAAAFGRAILVIKSQRKLYLFDKDKLIRTFPIAVGQAQYPTPAGDWQIVEKRYMPTWTNPGDAWSAGMPPSIPPGPSNPLGTRALDLDASGIRIHGTSNDFSIGEAASHGCMRMHMWDIERLYDMVQVGVPVFIRESG
jgi:lipoprotein-anchoring transpeptidase ErfK/SrfK